jgi:phage terminase small subunit
MRAFAREYVVDFNGSAAAIRAGYSSKYPDRQASTLLKHKGVAAYIDHLSQSKEAAIISIDPDYVISQVTQIISKDGTKDGDKLRALELLARHLGMFIERTEISGKDGEAIAYKKVEEEVADFTRAIAGLSKRGGAGSAAKLALVE